ncbi:MAG: NAD(P)H-hydrate dehydratase [Patescibacteria group bacterium]|nr:NAD(P)H-hydrate dehydratase [Patescibacteria group bacterium]
MIVTKDDLKDLYIPPPDSHKGQNGKLLIIGGSALFHAASLWALTVASRIVDLVHYSSVPENNEIVQKSKEEFRNGIVVARNDIPAYIEEDDCILIGPGMTRDEETERLTNTLLHQYPHKQWVIDAGALQMIDVSLIPQRAILTPHHGEFQRLLEKSKMLEQSTLEESVMMLARNYQCIILHKGKEDIVCDGTTQTMRRICGGNAGMTKGGTGDVLAGLVAALACKNDPFLAAIAGSFINKQAGDSLYQTVGPFFNATDLANEIPKVMKTLFL